MVVTWKSAKDVIYIATIAIGVAYHFIDKAKSDATSSAELATAIREISEINEKLDRYEQYWLNQNKINGRIIAYIDMLPRPGAE